MSDLEDLGFTSISDMQTDEALELLRQIRLQRRMPVKQIKSTPSKSKQLKPPSVDATQAAELLKILGGSK